MNTQIFYLNKYDLSLSFLIITLDNIPKLSLFLSPKVLLLLHLMQIMDVFVLVLDTFQLSLDCKFALLSSLVSKFLTSLSLRYFLAWYTVFSNVKTNMSKAISYYCNSLVNKIVTIKVFKFNTKSE